MSSSSTSSGIKILSTTAVTPQGGVLHRVQHRSTSTNTDMVFAIFLPSPYATRSQSQSQSSPFPALYYLSGLTCTDQNFCQKAGGPAFAEAEKFGGIALVVPDTSPRGDEVPNDDKYDLGQGAGFYVNATQDPWKDHYRMESYVSEELPALVLKEWGVGGSNVRSVFGHSMGGHGALTVALKSALKEGGDGGADADATPSWVSVSAFAPICHPTACPWGQNAFTNYLGSVEAGSDHDATLLLAKIGAAVFDDIMIDEGTDDEFVAAGQLLLADFEAAAAKVGQKLAVRRLPGFDHSYHFMAAFVADHVAYHAKRLRVAAGRVAAQQALEAKAALVESPPDKSTAGKPITCRAMVARAPKQPMVLETITVDPPRAGEVRVKVVANALCHTVRVLVQRSVERLTEPRVISPDFVARW
jgi:S-(hydroxymethyl)glutathione dehydrogenase / alcohol dehydrogenase